MRKNNVNTAILEGVSSTRMVPLMVVMGLSLFMLLYMMPAKADVVNINKADSKTLQHYLAGVGQKKANLIVLYRRLHGPIASVADLMRIPGITRDIILENLNNIGFRHGMVGGMGYGNTAGVSPRVSKSKSNNKQVKRSDRQYQARRYNWVRQVNANGNTIDQLKASHLKADQQNGNQPSY